MFAVPPWPHVNTVKAASVDRRSVISMSWNAPDVPTEELPITGYKIRYHSTDSDVSGSQVQDVMQSPAEVTGLLPGIEYRVYVASINAIGIGQYCCKGTAVIVRTHNGRLRNLK